MESDRAEGRQPQAEGLDDEVGSTRSPPLVYGRYLAHNGH